MEIRRLQQQDAAALWKLRMRALETDPWSFVESPEELRGITAEEYASRLRPSQVENFVLGAFDAEALVATAGFYQELPLKRRHKGWIWGVYVVPGARGRGIARSLMVAAIAQACAIRGMEMILITVSVGQPAPRKLYESLGFRSIGIEPRGLKIGGQHLDEEHMVLEFHNSISPPLV